MMRVVFLAAGAAGMYCGSCLRDNRLAATLIAQGRDVVLIPLYTPIRTDEVDVSRRSVFYGGINVYLRQRSALFRFLPRALTRILDAPVLLNQAGRLVGATRPRQLGALTVSVLQGAHGPQRKELDRLVRGLDSVKPDIVNLPNLMFTGAAAHIKRTLGVPVVCTLGGEDIFLDGLMEPFRRQAFDLIRRRSEDIDAFIAVTDYYAKHATRHFDLPSDRTHVVKMGIKTGDFQGTAAPTAGPFTIGYLARVCPEKGLATLCDAVGFLRRSGRNCRIRAAGYLGRADRPYLEEIRAGMKAVGLEHAFEYIGEVDRAGKLAFLRSLHLFSVPAVYSEAKGFYVLESMACGVPVVQPNRGAFPEILSATDGGLLYDDTGPEALADAIARLMDDEVLRYRLAANGSQAVRACFTDELMAERTWSLCRRLCDGISPSGD